MPASKKWDTPGFSTRPKQVFLNIYKCLIRPQLEFANLIWHPTLIKHQKILENVQRRASGIKNLSFFKRLKELYLSLLKYRRKRGTMIEMYKICYGFYDRNATVGLFERNDRDSRGNACKVVVRKANLEMRNNFFKIRAPLDWNNLPQKQCKARPSTNSIGNWTNIEKRLELTCTNSNGDRKKHLK